MCMTSCDHMHVCVCVCMCCVCECVYVCMCVCVYVCVCVCDRHTGTEVCRIFATAESIAFHIRNALGTVAGANFKGYNT